MQLGFRWLKEFADFDWTAQELCHRLTMAGVACETKQAVFQPFSGVVIGKIMSVEPLPESSTLKVCQVDTGLKTVTTLCGAPNVTTGLKSPFATVGSILPGGLKIEVIEKSGVKSEGMLCSEKELGLTDDGSIIMELEQALKTGADFWDQFELGDPLIEFDLTPNRPDCLSAIGIAREIAALAGTKLKYPKCELAEIEKEAAGAITIELVNPEACPRYVARVIEEVTIAPSPFWLKRKLVSAGIRPINNVVDITNLVLMEYGHPLHAFDFDLFALPQILVRLAQDKEKFTTLDGQEHELKSEDILITDSSAPVALAGIMGGLNTEVRDSTRRILLESAYFNPIMIRRTRKRLGLQSESAIRFEKGADPGIVDKACDYAALLLSKLAGGKVLSGRVDNYPHPVVPISLNLRPSRVNQVLATNITTPQMIDILGSLEFGVKTGKEINVTIPTFRPDCTREIDLVEEIGRIYGYEKIGTSLKSGGEVLTGRSLQEKSQDRIRENLTRQGLYEILTINLIDPEKARKIGLGDEFIKILNPLSPELSAFRTSLMPSMLQVIAYNLNRRQEDIKLFELGTTALQSGENAHREEIHLAIGVCGRPDIRNWASSPMDYDFYDLKGIIQDFCDGLNLGKPSLKRHDFMFYRKELSFQLYFGDSLVGHVGEISPEALELFDINRPLYYLECESSKFLEQFGQVPIYSQIPRFPSIWRDIAVIVDQNVLAEELTSVINFAAGAFAPQILLGRAELFDVYTGKQIEEGKKSLAFNLEFRSDEKTLTDEEVEPVFSRVIAQLQTQYNAKLRT